MQRALGRSLEANELIDHKNRDRLDNRRSNLRIATTLENVANNVRRNISGYRGVTKRQNVRIGVTYTAKIHYERMVIYIGKFQTAEEAAIAYDCAAIQLFGEFATLNIL